MRKAATFTASLLVATAAICFAPLRAESEPKAQAASVSKLDPRIAPFVEKYCSECHNDFNDEGDRTFDPFLTAPTDPKHHRMLEEMLEQLNLGKMPKQAANVLQPTDEERRATVAALTDYLIEVAVSKHPQETPLRRLSNAEFKNTLEDMFGVDPATLPSLISLPADTGSHGFVKLGEAQAMSLTQLQAYVTLAKEVVDAAFIKADAVSVPAVTTRYGPRDFIPETRYPAAIGLVPLIAGEDGSFFDMLGGREDANNPIMPLPYLEQGGAPADGEYVMRVKAEGLNRFFDYKLPHDFHYPSGPVLKLGVGTVPNKDSIRKFGTSDRNNMFFVDLPDNEAKEYEFRFRMNKGNIPYIYWPNGAHVGHYEIMENAKRFYPHIIERFYTKDGELPRDETGEKHPEYLHFVRHVFKGPKVRVHSVELSGPFPIEQSFAIDSADLKRYRAGSVRELDQILVDFSTKAFRRPTTKAEVSNFSRLVRHALDGGKDWETSLKLGFTAVLSSPRFLYLQEGENKSGDALDSYDLASRLSYFLWSTMPDQALLADAASGALADKAVLSRHVERMLKDERSEAFVSGFATSWLRLDKLGQMPPDPQIYWSAYYKNRLESAMRKETKMFLHNAVAENLAPRTFLDAKFTFLNDALAKHYGIEGDFGEEMVRANLPENSPRRGIIGHASILTASANGVETSPVVRGVWLLDNLLGMPPSPPPPDVPAIEPDTRGASTIREQLAKHRNVQACADCHAHIDPFGFPLESFGPTGEFRKRYAGVRDGKTVLEQGLPIDTTTELATGRKITTAEDFHQVLLDHERSFKLNLVSKMLVYGTGREMTFRDRREVEAIVERLDKKDGGMRDLIVMAATSKIFTSQ